MNWMKNLLLLIVLLSVGMQAYSQSETEIFEENIALLQDMVKEDRSVVDALVMYSEETLISILEVSAYPELLVRADGMQAKTQKAFQDVMQKYEREHQEEMYDLVRYDGLIKSLVEGGEKSKDDLQKILANYPEEIHETAMKYGSKKKYESIKEIYDLNNKIAEAVAKVISRYPAEVQEAVTDVIGLPEVMTLLVDNMSFTVVLSDLYKSDPEYVLNKAKELNQKLAEENARELAEYEEELKNNPEAYEEMLALAEQYAKDNGVEEYKQPQQTAPIHQPVYSYPYWYGYPYWYSTPYWSPVPMHYHTGFYFGSGGVAIHIGFPSGFYVGWHHHYYPNHYHHLSSHYSRHYYSHPYSNNHFHNDIDIHVNNNTNVNIDRTKIKNDYKDLWEGSDNFDRNELQKKMQNGEIDRNEVARKMENRGLDASSVKNANVDREQLANKAKASGVTKQDVQNKAQQSGVSKQDIQKKAQQSGLNKQDIQKKAQNNTDLQNKIQQSYRSNASKTNAQQKAQNAARNNNSAAQQRAKSSYNNYKAQNNHSSNWNKSSGNNSRPTNNNSYSRPSNSSNYSRPSNTSQSRSYSRPTGGGSSFSRPSGGFKRP